MSYLSTLPEVFPHCLMIEEAQLARVIAALVAPDGQCTNGSSFAVTVNTQQSMRLLWLSEASMERCKRILPEVL